jgi:hypothetical protein
LQGHGSASWQSDKVFRHPRSFCRLIRDRPLFFLQWIGQNGFVSSNVMGSFRSRTTQFNEHRHFPNRLERPHDRFTKCNLHEWIDLL